MVRLHSLKHLALIATLGFLGASSASAGTLQIDLSYGGIDTINILDNATYDLNPAPNVIQVDLDQINAILVSAGYGDLVFKSLSANSNNPGNPTGARLKVDSDAVAAAGSSVFFTLTTFQTGFIIPTGVGTLSSSAGGAWTQTDTDNTATFQSSYKNSLYTSDQLFTSPDTSLPQYAGTAGYNGSSSPLALGVVTAPFSLWNQTTITLSSANNLEAENQFSGTTVLRAVAIPEPASVIMMLSAAPAIALLRRFRSR